MPSGVVTTFDTWHAGSCKSSGEDDSCWTCLFTRGRELLLLDAGGTAAAARPAAVRSVKVESESESPVSSLSPEGLFCGIKT